MYENTKKDSLSSLVCFEKMLDRILSGPQIHISCLFDNVLFSDQICGQRLFCPVLPPEVIALILSLTSGISF